MYKNLILQFPLQCLRTQRNKIENGIHNLSSNLLAMISNIHLCRNLFANPNENNQMAVLSLLLPKLDFD